MVLSGCKAKRVLSDGDVTVKYPQSFDNVMIAQASPREAIGPCEPSIAVSFANPNIVAAGSVLNRMHWSSDGGRTWQNGVLKSTHGVFGDPVLLSDSKGTIYYAHLSDPEQKGWSSKLLLDRIVIQRSTDGGKTYDDGGFCGFAHPKDQDKHWLIADPKTNALYCTWTEFDEYENPDTTKFRSRILFSKSTDGGQTWSSAIRLSQFEGDCMDDDYTTEGATPAVGPNGEIYVTWSWNKKIWLDYSLDGGQTWQDKDIVVSNQPGGWTLDIEGVSRCNGMPVLVCDLSNSPHRGALYVNWADQRNGEKDTDIWMAKSTDGGKTWSTPRRVNSDGKGHQQFLTWTAIDQTTGYLYTVFYDRRARTDVATDVYVATSRDGGQTFTNLLVSKEPFSPNSLTFFGDYNNIAAHAGVVRPIWTRLEKGNLSVWTAIMDFK